MPYPTPAQAEVLERFRAGAYPHPSIRSTTPPSRDEVRRSVLAIIHRHHMENPMKCPHCDRQLRRQSSAHVDFEVCCCCEATIENAPIYAPVERVLPDGKINGMLPWHCQTCAGGTEAIDRTN